MAAHLLTSSVSLAQVLEKLAESAVGAMVYCNPNPDQHSSFNRYSYPFKGHSRRVLSYDKSLEL